MRQTKNSVLFIPNLGKLLGAIYVHFVTTALNPRSRQLWRVWVNRAAPDRRVAIPAEAPCCQVSVRLNDHQI